MLMLDTHIWIYWQNNQALPTTIINKIQTADKLAISAVSCWELAQLIRKKRIILPIPVKEWVELATINVEILSLNKEIALLAETLPFHHKDPADRFIIATSLFYQMPIISLDTIFPQYQEISHLLIK